VLKEKLLALKEEDLPHILAASGLKLRGEDANIVDGLLVDLFGVVDPEKHGLRRDELRRILTTLIKRIDSTPKTREITMHYRLPVTGATVASPRRAAARPAITMIRRLALYGFKRNPPRPGKAQGIAIQPRAGLPFPVAAGFKPESLRT
jgi:hypothetical protein